MASLRDFLSESDVYLSLQGTDKRTILAELVGHLGLSPDNALVMLKVLERRENLGSTGIGGGVAIPHCRTQLVPRLRVLFGRIPEGIPWEATDGKPVYWIFLLAAPPVEVSNDYLPVLGRVAQLMKDSDMPVRLAGITSPDALMALLHDRGV